MSTILKEINLLLILAHLVIRLRTDTEEIINNIEIASIELI